MARRILERHWRPAGYTVPNARTYPFLWLWDSCFHAVCWARFGHPDRALDELRAVLHYQTDGGFVPHMSYFEEPDRHLDLWGRRHRSTITQPPMYGHAIAELQRLGVPVESELIERARAGIGWLLRERRHDGGILLCHPWESGMDDSPRWDRWCEGSWNLTRWRAHKQAMAASLVLDREGAAIANPRFASTCAGFDALVAFNADELGVAHDLTPPSTADALLDSLLPALVTTASTARPLLDDAIDPTRFGALYGPAFVRRDDARFDPDGYWRGSSWPQLTYLLVVAARRSGHTDHSDLLADALRAGARHSGFAEHWNPLSGAPRGARPQSWTALAAVV